MILKKWCLETGLNRRHTDFQSVALPAELPRHFHFNVAGVGYNGLRPDLASTVSVMPAKAGIHRKYCCFCTIKHALFIFVRWIPAYAGMTLFFKFREDSVHLHPVHLRCHPLLPEWHRTHSASDANQHPRSATSKMV